MVSAGTSLRCRRRCPPGFRQRPALPNHLLPLATPCPLLHTHLPGMLVSPADLEASWAKKFWFSAALSATAFACMMAMLGSGRDAATYGSWAQEYRS